MYLAGNGYGPRITVRDGNGDVAFADQVPFLAQDGNYTSTGVVKAADAAPRQVGLRGLFLPTAVVDPEQGPVSVFPDARDPRLFLTAYAGDLGLDDGVPQSVYELDTTEMAQLEREPGTPFSVALAPGESVELPDGAGTVEFTELTRFAGLTIHHDPGKGAALVFSVRWQGWSRRCSCRGGASACVRPSTAAGVPRSRSPRWRAGTTPVWWRRRRASSGRSTGWLPPRARALGDDRGPGAAQRRPRLLGDGRLHRGDGGVRRRPGPASPWRRRPRPGRGAPPGSRWP